MEKFNKYIKLSLVVVAFCCTLACNKNDNKQTQNTENLNEDVFSNVKIENEKFSVVFPEEPIYSVDTVLAMADNVVEHKYIYEKSITEVYLLSYFKQSIPQEEVEKRMYAAADELLTYLDLDYKDKKFVSTDSSSIFYFTAFSVDIFIDFQLIYADNYFYQIGVIMPFSYKINANVHPFINSFKLH